MGNPRNLRQIATPYPASDDLAAIRAVVGGERVDRSAGWYSSMGKATLAWLLDNDDYRLRFPSRY